MTKEELFTQACDRFDRSQDAWNRGCRREFVVQTIAHRMCHAAWKGGFVGDADEPGAEI